jgi:hypothetical protein
MRVKTQKLSPFLALVLWVSACHMSGTCKTNEDCPQEGAFCFRGNHPKPGSNGICSMHPKLIPCKGDNGDCPIHAQLSHSTLAFSPMKTDTHHGSHANFSVVVSGFQKEADADPVKLELDNADKPSWLSLGIQQGEFSEREGTQTFVVELRYLGAGFSEGQVTLRLSLGNIPEGYEYDEGPQSIRVVVGSGEKNHPIPVVQANIWAFNDYARTDGLGRHYRLFEDIVLEAPLPPAKSNWVAIGTLSDASSFTGSFDGDGHTLSGLVIHNPGSDYQALFGRISGSTAEIKNIGLIGVSVKGNNEVGSLVGYNSRGTVQNSYASGSVEGSSWVGGLVGNNLSTVHNCVALNPSVISSDGTGNNVGRVVGINDGSAPSMENNHAWEGMKVFYGADKNGNGGTPKTIENDGEGDSSSANGQSVSAGSEAGQHGNLSFWTNTMGWNFTIWQWGSNNLPILQNVGGAQNHAAP